MLTIYTDQAHIEQIEEVLNQYGLMPHVKLLDFMEHRPTSDGDTIIVNGKGITMPIDWYNVVPPYLFPEYIWFNESALVALVYTRLGHFEDAVQSISDNGNLRSDIEYIFKMTEGFEADPDTLSVETYNDYDDYRLMHNHAVVRHYATEQSHTMPDKIHYYYNAAIDAAINDELLAYTTKHYATFLIDREEYSLAKKMLGDLLSKGGLSKDATMDLTQLYCQVLTKSLHIPYDEATLEEIKNKLWTVVDFYESKNKKLNEAMALLDASHIANISNSFSESLGYITKSTNIYKDEGIEEMYYNAQLQKAKLLYAWAKNDQPQFFRPAVDAFQDTLQYFSKINLPYTFAEIQHHLGVIYSEIPDEVKKKSIWAAVSSSSFKEALEIYTIEDFPYEYAMVCNSFGNALTKYPLAVHSDNYEKALYYYNEALEIRTAVNYPYERSLTLLNYLEASWHADNAHDENNATRYADMVSKANEVVTLNASEAIVEMAKDHLEKLEKLSATMES
jgi:hypothetical protein